MSHNPMATNHQQQQHSVVINSTSGSQAQSMQQQRTMFAQRGAPVAKTSYPVSMSQYSQPQSASPLMGSYHKQQKQMSPDLGQFSSTLNLPAQNGTYQSTASTSLHSSLGYESNQLSLQQQQQQNLQASLPQYTSQQPSQTTSPMVYRQAYPASTQQSSHQHLIQQQKQQQSIQIQQTQPQIKQQPQIQQQTYQQQLQLQQHLQQRSLNQQQRFKTKQPKQILQNTSSDKIAMTPTPTNSAVINTTTHIGSSGTTQLHIDTNGQHVEPSTKDKNSEDSESIEKNRADSDTSSNASEKLSMANTKEKTPMCLINELARFNKMTHQYTLVDEQGPAHKKTFYVKLKLGDEEYSSSGESIKKAQHAAAAIALVESRYQHPPPKPARVVATSLEKTDGNITPTVELNALAMKRGEVTSYKSIEPQQPPYYHQPNMDFRGLYNQRYHQYMRGGRDPRYRGNGMMWPMRYHYPRMNRAFYVSLRVGHREFIGDGPTRQTARHNAAQKALRILKNLPIPSEPSKPQEEAPKPETDDSLKSEISLVHEIALRRNMNVQFEVTRETGPPHMKNFVSRCTVAHIVTEGEGNSKKLSKKKAAELMLEELRKLSPCPAPATSRPKAKNQVNKKKNRNIIKSELQQQKADPNYGVGINPISRLIQIMQAQRKKDPIYTLVAERGLPRRREFVVQVEVEEETCSGTGPNKKLAKRAAAEAMLQLLGYTKPSPQPTKSSFKNTSSETGQANGDRKMVTFVDADTHSESEPSNTPQQRIPGLIHLPSKTSAAISGRECSPKEAHVNLDNILKPNLRPEIQLRELCKAIGYQLEIDDFTKKHPNGTEHITRITVGSENPQSFHGSNTSLESSRDMAALDALKVLLAKVKNVHSAGDGPQVKKDLLIRTSPSNSGKKEVPK